MGSLLPTFTIFLLTTALVIYYLFKGIILWYCESGNHWLQLLGSKLFVKIWTLLSLLHDWFPVNASPFIFVTSFNNIIDVILLLAKEKRSMAIILVSSEKIADTNWLSAKAWFPIFFKVTGKSTYFNLF